MLLHGCIFHWKSAAYRRVTYFCFSFEGINEETGERTVGFRLGSYVSGTVGVASIGCLKNIPQRMKAAVHVSLMSCALVVIFVDFDKAKNVRFCICTHGRKNP